VSVSNVISPAANISVLEGISAFRSQSGGDEGAGNDFGRLMKPVDGSSDYLQDDLTHRMAAYKNVAHVNEAVYAEFAQRLQGIPFLKTHRDWVEEHKWGFGDRSFHYLWLLIVKYLTSAHLVSSAALEIGVYKGQILSLLALCADRLQVPLDIYAISPFSGNAPQSRILDQVRKIIQPRYRKLAAMGNVYAQNDYLAACRIIFESFDLDFGKVHSIRGKSSDPDVYGQIQDVKFGLIYIDGDQPFEGVTPDIVHYCPLIRIGGPLVMDDSSCEPPGEGFFKRFPAVSKVVRIIASLGFKNVLNAGHNRVYLRIE
jgi:hypothetical protein